MHVRYSDHYGYGPFFRAEIPSNDLSDLNRIKPYVVSSTRRLRTRCILERKSLEPKFTSGHLRFVDTALLCRSPDVPLLFLKGDGERAPPPSGPASARVTPIVATRLRLGCPHAGYSANVCVCVAIGVLALRRWFLADQAPCRVR